MIVNFIAKTVIAMNVMTAIACSSELRADTVTAFVQDPRAEPDLSCIETRKPQWVLPDG